MARTYWYCYDRSGRPTPPYFDSREEAADACEGGESPRPVSGSVIDVNDTDDALDETIDMVNEPAEEVVDGLTDDVPSTNLQARFDRGECPWCDEYSGDHVGRHASSAHPKRWKRFKESRDD